MNRYAYYALKCEDDDYAYTKPIEDLSFGGDIALTFSCDFYYEKGYSGKLFYQETGVCLEVKNGYVIWATDNGNSVKSNSIDSPLLEKTWNHIDIVYEAETLVLYVNRIVAERMTLKKASICRETNYLFGEHYPGYLRNIRIVNYALSQEAVIEQSTVTTLSEDKLLLYIPFDEAEVCDKGKNKLAVTCMGLARSIALVPALYFEKGGFVNIQNMSVNPGTDKMREFSIALRVFLYPKTANDLILFQNHSGTMGTKEEFSIKLNAEINEAYLTLQVGEFAYQENKISLSYFQWQDICVAVKEKQIKCYVNGTLIQTLEMSASYTRSSEAKIFLGNNDAASEKNIYGAIDYLAIYDKELDADYVKQIAEIEPYLYDKNICSLFLLHGESNYALVGDGVLTYSGTEIKLLEGTVFDKSIDAFQFRTCEEFSGNDLELWEADFVLQICSVGIQSMAGIDIMERMTPGAKSLLIDEVKVMPEAQKVFMEYDAIKLDDVMDLFKKMMKKPKVSNILFGSASAGGAAASTVTVATTQKYLEAEVMLAVLGFVSLLTQVIVEVVSETKPADPPDQPEEKPEKGYVAKMQTIQFYNEESGSLPLRKNFTEAQTLPEWSAAEGDTAIVAYIAKTQTPMLKISFQYIPAKDQDSATIKLKGKSKIFGDFETEEVNCTEAGTYTTTAVLHNFGINESSKMDCVTEAIKFSYNSYLEVDTLCCSSHVKIHIIKGTPLKPWSITDKVHYVTIELLDIIADMKNTVKKAIDNITDFMRVMHEYIHSNKKLTFSQKERYTAISDTSVVDIEFDYAAITKAFLADTASLGSLDISAFCKYLAAVEGMDIQIFGFFGFEYPITHKDETKIGYCGIRLENAEAFGSDVSEQIVRHYTMGQAISKEDLTVYDLVLNLKGSLEYIGGLQVSEYQKKLGVGEDDMQLGFIGYTIVEKEDVVTAELNIGFDPEEGFQSSPRVSFKSYVKEIYSYPFNEACCHRLSYNTIETILIDTFNHLLQEDFSQEMQFILESLFNMFYKNSEMVSDKEVLNMSSLKLEISILKTVTFENLQDPKNCDEVSKSLSRVMNCLNSALRNLRTGYSSWNSSIGDAYDLENYYCVFDINGYRYYTDRTGQIEPCNLQLENGTYAICDVDRNILYNLVQINQMLGENYCNIIGGFRKATIDGMVVMIPFVYSSNNEFGLEESSQRMPNVDVFF